MSLHSTYTIAQPIFARSRRDWLLARRDWAFVCIGSEGGIVPTLQPIMKPGFDLASYQSNSHLFNLEPETIQNYSGRERSKATKPT
ncbi:MAG: hypothetical protein SW833_22480 [Cyanobacteriota bacterium]|nr:hypothetical protein [Cyanobacteriota bacterium]